MKRILNSRLLSDYGSVFVLLALCLYYSFATLSEQHPVSARAGRKLGRAVVDQLGSGAGVLIVIRKTEQDRAFAEAIEAALNAAGADALETVAGNPSDVRAALERIASSGQRLDAIATHAATSEWGPLRQENLDRLAETSPSLGRVRVFTPPGYIWPSFLTRENLLNVINQNADIAILAIGMTMVIITAGIDLSVGSLLALSGVTTAVAVAQLAGGAEASLLGLAACCLLGIGVCGLFGTFHGVIVTFFHVPSFVVTLGTMMIARGLSLIIAVRHQSALSGGATQGTPEAVKIEAAAFGWLGDGSLLGIPNPILLMIAFYVIAHLAMNRTVFGRYVYAVGGNPEAARLSGVPVFGTLIAVYALCGTMAGLGGIVDASRFEGGRPNAGEFYELQVIAAVVVGGTSLAGGEGRIFGTLIGSLIIAVIQNGLNMAGVKSYEQKVVFGILILVAVLVDQLKQRKT